MRPLLIRFPPTRPLPMRPSPTCSFPTRPRRVLARRVPFNVRHLSTRSLLMCPQRVLPRRVPFNVRSSLTRHSSTRLLPLRVLALIQHAPSDVSSPRPPLISSYLQTVLFTQCFISLRASLFFGAFSLTICFFPHKLSVDPSSPDASFPDVCELLRGEPLRSVILLYLRLFTAHGSRSALRPLSLHQGKSSNQSVASMLILAYIRHFNHRNALQQVR